jgi:hypothetical protein
MIEKANEKHIQGYDPYGPFNTGEFRELLMYKCHVNAQKIPTLPCVFSGVYEQVA